MSNVSSIDSIHSAAPAAVPEAPAPRARPVNDDLLDRFDPSARQAEAALIDAPNPTVVRYLTMETRRKREAALKPAFKQMWSSMKRKPQARRGMDKAIRRETALKDELRTLNKFIDDEWKRAQDCFKLGDAAGVRVHRREMTKLMHQADRLKTDLQTVQDLECVLVEQLSSDRMMDVHENAMRALKNLPNANEQLEDRLDALEKIKDRHTESDQLLREKLEVAPDDDAEMAAFMEKLAQHTAGDLGDTVKPVRTPAQPVRNSQQWQPIYE